jgi:hypothetical protein
MKKDKRNRMMGEPENGNYVSIFIETLKEEKDIRGSYVNRLEDNIKILLNNFTKV